VWDALVAFDGSPDQLVVRDLRVPRTLLGVVVGAAFGLGGALAQALTRNPIADPGLLGVNAGAALGVVVAIVVAGVSTFAGWVGFALVGAGLSSLAVHVLALRGRDGGRPTRLVLAGAAMTALLTSLTTTVLLTDQQALDAFRFWVVGSLSGRQVGVAAEVLPFLLVGAVLALAAARGLDALALGEDTARALGRRVGAVRALAALAITLLTGAAVAAAGPIAFVGLVVPHAARAVAGHDLRRVLAVSAVLGPVLLLAADVAGRLVVRPAELQAGVMTALVGAGALVVIARRTRAVGL
jgi:iron complex transport system permease protein